MKAKVPVLNKDPARHNNFTLRNFRSLRWFPSFQNKIKPFKKIKENHCRSNHVECFAYHQGSLGHVYWHQVQGQMYLTNINLCYFVLWTTKDVVVLYIARDESWKKSLYTLRDVLSNFPGGRRGFCITILKFIIKQYIKPKHCFIKLYIKMIKLHR